MQVFVVVFLLRYVVLVLEAFDGPRSDRPLVPDRSDVEKERKTVLSLGARRPVPFKQEWQV